MSNEATVEILHLISVSFQSRRWGWGTRVLWKTTRHSNGLSHSLDVDDGGTASGNKVRGYQPLISLVKG